MIECHTLFGEKKLIPAESLSFRPSVYAIITHENSVMLAKMRSTGKYCLPGGGIELGEKIEDALKREVLEETGVHIEVLRNVFFKEDFFYYDPLDTAFHSFIFFYLCKPVTLQVLPDEKVDDDEAVCPRWVAIPSLQAKDFHADGQVILQLLQKRNQPAESPST